MDGAVWPQDPVPAGLPATDVVVGVGAATTKLVGGAVTIQQPDQVVVNQLIPASLQGQQPAASGTASVSALGGVNSSGPVISGPQPDVVLPDLKAPAVSSVRFVSPAPAVATGAPDSVMQFELIRSDGVAKPGVAQVRIDMSAYLHQHGADWLTRLRVKHQAPCAVLAVVCPEPVAVPTRFDPNSKSLIALVPVDGDPAVVVAGADAAAAAPAGVSVNSVSSSASGMGGDFRATSLAPSASWAHSGSSGSFTYTYPFTLPMSVNGPAPDLKLTYDSGSVDGMTGSTNTQASWVGLGWDLPIGFIERRYTSCAADGTTDSRAADLCWAGNNAVLSLNGQSGNLVRDTTDGTKWRLANDPGWKIEKLNGASANGDNDNEYWRITDQKGWRYYFGYGVDPRSANTNSVSNVPVFGNDSGEPCYSATVSASWCMQGWRWNLDRIIDPHGIQTVVHYTQELNKYGRQGSSSNATTYVRASYPDSLEYGLESPWTSRRQVAFTVQDRCADLDASCPTPTPSLDSSYPDAPLDLLCTGSTCTEHSPTFFTTKRLVSVSAQAWSSTSAVWQTVDTWNLTHVFVDPDPSTSADDDMQALWLTKIQRTGLYSPNKGFTGSLVLPSTLFSYVRLNNRADYDVSAGVLPIPLPRIDQVRSELDAVTDVTYDQPDPCADKDGPWDHNTQDCFPQFWVPEGSSGGFGVFNKWVVTQIADSDDAGQTPARPVAYTYTGAAWHHDDDPRTPASQRSWSQWRGYQKVTEVAGTQADRQRTVTSYFQGMNNDPNAGSPPTKTVSLSTTNGTPVSYPDWNYLAGQVLESTHTTPGATARYTADEHEYWTQLTSNATGNELNDAFYVRPSKVDSYDWGDGTGTPRHTQESTDYDSTYGFAVDVVHSGDVAVSGDNSCTTYLRYPSASTWFVDYVARVELHFSSCATGTVFQRSSTYYDGQAINVSPTKGDATTTVEYKDDTTPLSTVNTYDSYGRLASTDAPGHGKVTTTQSGPFPTSVTTTTTNVSSGVDLGSVETLDAIRRMPLSETNNSATISGTAPVTTLGYDSLGRLTGVWLPGRTSPATANVIYDYNIGDVAQPSVTTQTLQSGSTYLLSVSMYDSYGEIREIQTPARGGGRTVTGTRYDDVGRASVQIGAFYNSSPAGSTVVDPSLVNVGSYVQLGHDGSGRVTTETTGSFGVAQFSTSHTYDPGAETVTPPQRSATTTFTDGVGRVSEIDETQANSTSPTATTKLTYGYNTAGDLTKVSATNSVTGTAPDAVYTYDWLGRRLTASDPDSGPTTSVYTDSADTRTVATTVGTGTGAVTTTATYDGAGRHTQDSVGGAARAKWTYGTATATSGLLASTAAYDTTAAALMTTSYSYDNRGQVTAMDVPQPAVSSTPYHLGFTYDEAGHQVTKTYPAVGNMSAETVTTTYDQFGSVNKLAAPTRTYTTVVYDNLGRPSERDLGTKTSAVDRIWVDRQYSYNATLARVDDATTTRHVVVNTTDTQTTYSHSLLGFTNADLTSIDETSANAPADAERQCFDYDQRGRLTEAWTLSEGSSCSGDTFWHAGAAGYKSTYAYDGLSRLTSAVLLRDVPGSTDESQSLTYGYSTATPNPFHGPVTVTGKAGGNVTLTYPATKTGRVSTDTQGSASRTLAYDWAGRLQQVTRSGTGGTTPGGPGTSASYAYTADGDLWRRTDASGTTYYVGGDQLFQPAGVTGAANTRLVRTYTAGGTPVAVRTTTPTTSTGGVWLANDIQNTPSVEIDWDTGAVTKRLQDAYGGVRNGLPTQTSGGTGTTGTSGDATLSGYATLPGQRGFLGKTEDPTTNLDLLGARTYDPGLGIFLQPDPLLDPRTSSSISAYLYAGGNPVGFVDPSGLRTRPLGDGGVCDAKCNTLLNPPLQPDLPGSAYCPSVSRAGCNHLPGPYRPESSTVTQVAVGGAIVVVGGGLCLLACAAIGSAAGAWLVGNLGWETTVTIVNVGGGLLTALSGNPESPETYGGFFVGSPRGFINAASTTRLTAAEQATAARLQQLPQFVGRTFSESPHVGAEYVDDLGRSFDAIGSPAASTHWNQAEFLRSIDSHLLKSNDFTVVDLTGFSSEQTGVVSRYVDALSPEIQGQIVRIGF